MLVTRSRQLMQRALLLSVVLSACSASAPPERYGFLTLLGRDTIAVESITRSGNEVTSDAVDRFPRVRQRHTRITLAADGSIRHLEMDIRTPSEPSAQRLRHVVADVTSDSVKITKRDSSGVKNIAFATGGSLTMPHLPMMYGLTDLYFAAALTKATAANLAPGDSIRLRQYYIDREFDNFPLHEGFVRPSADRRKAELWHDWLAGVGDATFDAGHHMLTYSGARSTYKVSVTRLANAPDVQPIGARFAATESSAGGMHRLSVRDTARASIGGATFEVVYGRPLARGRALLGDVLPYDRVWRTGANEATQFSTSAPITLAGIKVPAGKYTLWTVPREKGANLIVNRQTGQWGTGYDDSFDIDMKPLTTETVATPVEKFTISIVPGDAHHGALVLEWGTFRWTAPIVMQ